MKIAAVRKFAMSLPETEEKPHFHFSSFRVAGRIFVTVPPDEVHIHVFVADKDREPALELYSEYVEKLWWGKKVCGLKLALENADAGVVKSLVRAAWSTKAPKRLIKGTADTAASPRAK